ncbi:Tau-tubulin kinase 2 [Toxocara canis]|uniref:Tau-tubulin kinase 2 n=1 Tax=Toxocara canis TaxID=6265 RepID=A0A0B2URF0_TOXCA|nr:Tau-tubulin kinase 2 [Toxocara canis]
MTEPTCDSANPIVEFPIGKVIGTRWKITKRIGNGAYGAVYEARSLRDDHLFAALKVESNDAEESILKVEVEVLKHLLNRPNTVRLLHSGKREMYSYLVMTLCGPDLTQLKSNNKLLVFSESTTLRLGIHCLFAIKQIHEVGYVHRDIKPSNMAIGATSSDCRLIYLIDYGMVRRYADRRKGKWLIRAPRKKALLRGTLRYCSMNTHKRIEQASARSLYGRVDDLWSLIYMLVDLRTNFLPWGRTRREDRILYLKEKTSDRQLTAGCKIDCYEKVLAHLRGLKYANRPNYIFIYETMMGAITRKNYLFSDPYDWETATAKSTKHQTASPNSSGSSVPEVSSRTARLEVVERVLPSDKFGINEKEFPTACYAAFADKDGDVPDVSKTKYYVSTGRSIRQQQYEKTCTSKETSVIDILP